MYFVYHDVVVGHSVKHPEEVLLAAEMEVKEVELNEAKVGIRLQVINKQNKKKSPKAIRLSI